MKTHHITYLSLGTNQGNKLKNLQIAIDLIADNIGVIYKIASVYKTASWGFEGNDFYNTVIKVATTLQPETVLSKALKIEKKLGRVRNNSKNYSNRIIDVDILLDNHRLHIIYGIMYALQ